MAIDPENKLAARYLALARDRLASKPTRSGTQASSQSLIQLGLGAYKKQDYKVAIRAFTEVLAREPGNALAAKYLALAKAAQ